MPRVFQDPEWSAPASWRSGNLPIPASAFRDLGKSSLGLPVVGIIVAEVAALAWSSILAHGTRDDGSLWWIKGGDGEKKPVSEAGGSGWALVAGMLFVVRRNAQETANA